MSGPISSRPAEPSQRASVKPASCRAPAGRWTRRLTLLAAVALTVVYSGYQRQPCGADAGRRLNGDVTAAPPRATRHTPRATRHSLRIGTLNMHGGKGRDGRRDLVRTAELLAELDFAALNEVQGAFGWQTAGQAEQLGRRLGLRWLFAPTEERWWHYRFGNCALSSLEVTNWQIIPLRRETSHTYRNAVLLAARHDGAAVHIVATHLERGDEREREHQLRAVSELFLALAEPAILLGDLNTTLADTEMQRLISQPGVHDPLGEALGAAAPPHIDWILTRGLRTLDAGLIDNGASDHPLLWAELALPDPQPSPADAAMARRTNSD
jgi:endonuclease/exonuclease/phosphatase family metal-dependent hydrolase